jgi:hypothetical protein
MKSLLNTIIDDIAFPTRRNWILAIDLLFLVEFTSENGKTAFYSEAGC